MYSFTFYLSLLIVLPCSSLALPHDFSRAQILRRGAWEKGGFDLPIHTRRGTGKSVLQKRGNYSGAAGLGDFADLFYTVPITIGNTQTAVNLDTGSSDLWIISDACKTDICKKAVMPPYPSSQLQPAGGSVSLLYGDSSTGTQATGPVGEDTGVIAGLSMPQQAFAAISDTNNTSVMNGASGIFGLGFPSGSQVQAAVVNAKFNTPTQTDEFVQSTAADGPLLSRLAISGALEQPMFTISLQRDTIDVGGQTGALTVGKLPDGVDNSSLTWVPVRLYDPSVGGLKPPTFALNEIYPLRWEVQLDAVFLDGQALPTSAISAQGISNPGVTALIDTGNSIIRGPNDVVASILKSVSPAYAASSNAAPTFPCATSHNLTFQIGGKLFPVDPRDFVAQNQTGDANTCIANNVIGTDPPSSGALFSWSLGDPFFKSTLVAFHYGNLTHPSVDPPRIGFLSAVPTNADDLLEQEVKEAQANSGNFESTSQAAPTGPTSSIAIAPSSVSISTPSSSGDASPPTISGSPKEVQDKNSAARRSAHVGTGTALSTLFLSALFWALLVF